MRYLLILFLSSCVFAAGNQCVDAADGNTSSSSTWSCFQMTKVQSFVGGSGGTTGTYTATASGGTCSVQPTVKYAISGGAITSVWLLPDFQKGSYGRCTVAPTTVTLAGSGGSPTGASITLALAGSAVTVPGNGDQIAVNTHHVTINGNLGTTAGGGINRIDMFRVSGTAATLDVDCTSPRTLIFASTGNNAFGSGTSTNGGPGTDANMYGIGNGGGTLNLTCGDSTHDPNIFLKVSSVTYSTSPTTITLDNSSPTTSSVNGITYNYSGQAPATDTGVTIFSPSCPALDGQVLLVTNTGTTTFTVPVDTHTCSAAFGTSSQDSITENILTVAAANGTSPTYIAQGSAYLGTTQAQTSNLNYVSVQSTGTSTSSINEPQYQGIGFSGSSGNSTQSIQHTYVAGGCTFLLNQAQGVGTIAQSLAGPGFTCGGASTGIMNSSAANSGSASETYTDLVFMPQTNSGMDTRYAIQGGYFGSTFSASRIAVEGSSTVRQSGVRNQFIGTSTAGTSSLTDILCGDPGSNTFPLNSSPDYCAYLSVPTSPASMSLNGLVADGLDYGANLVNVGASNGAGTLTNMWSAQKAVDSSSGPQGIYILRSGSWSISKAVGIIDVCVSAGNSPGNCTILFGWPGSGSPLGWSIDQVVADTNNQGAGIGAGYEVGSALAVTGVALRSSLLSDSYAANPSWYSSHNHPCWTDNTSTTGGGTVAYVADSLASGATVGAHNNFTYNCDPANIYTANGSSNFQSGVTAHPNAIYYDVDSVNPRRLAPTRRVANADSALFGGPGTQDHLFREMAKISGFGGPYTLTSTGQLPIAQIRQWLMQGQQPTNLAYKGAGWNGVDIGAVPITIFGTPGANTSNSATATSFSGGVAF